MPDWFTKTTYGALPAQAAKRWGAREAMVFEGQRWSFNQLSERYAQILVTADQAAL